MPRWRNVKVTEKGVRFVYLHSRLVTVPSTVPYSKYRQSTHVDPRALLGRPGGGGYVVFLRNGYRKPPCDRRNRERDVHKHVRG